jgi:regulator of RNase E activity RraA
MPTGIHRPNQVRPPPDLLARWTELPVTIVAGLFQGATLLDPVIRPQRPLGDSRLAGTAVTVRCTPGDDGAVHHAIDVAEAGQVIVIDAGGRPEAAHDRRTSRC